MWPKLTIAIPTYNRYRYLQYCLESIERQTHAREVEVLISDNNSVDLTEDVVASFMGKLHISYIRNYSNTGFDLNYIQCLKHARGEKLLVLGDDDALMGDDVVSRIINCYSDLQLLTPIEFNPDMTQAGIRYWFDDHDQFDINTRTGLIDYMNKSNFEACLGAFISVIVLPTFKMKQLSLDLANDYHRMHTVGKGEGFPNLTGAIRIMLEGTSLCYDPQPSIMNRLGNDGLAATNPFRRSMIDVWAFLDIGRSLLKDRPEVRQAFYGVHRRNFNGRLPLFVKSVAPSVDHWEKAKKDLLEIGYPEEMCK